MSLRVRLFLLTVSCFTAGLVAAAIAVPILVHGYLLDRLDDRLPDNSVIDVAPIELIARLPDSATAAIERPLDLIGAWVRLTDADGTVQFESFLDSGDGLQVPDVEATRDALPGKPFDVKGNGAGQPMRYRAVLLDLDGGGTAVVALPSQEIYDTVGRIIRVELVVGGLLMGVVGTGTWWLVGVGLGPLRHVERSARAFAAEGFGATHRGRRIGNTTPDSEVGQLTATLNDMLAAIDDALDETQASNNRLRQFVADASHELRTPLTSIQGYAQLHLRGAATSVEGSTAIERIESEAARMALLIDDLLKLARLDEQPALQLRSTDIADLATRVVDALETGRSRRVAVIDAGQNATAMVDAGKLGQALTNLVVNAMIHAPGSTSIEVRFDTSDDAIEIAIIDHGPGISDEHKTRIFDRFYRVDPGRARAAGGTGLGLAIVAATVSAHHGRLTVSDTPGGGATFTMRLPSGGPPA